MSHLRKAPKAKGGEGSGGVNEDIAAFLFELANYEKNVTRDQYKHSAYRKAAAAIASHPEPIKSGKEAQAIKGVGKKVTLLSVIVASKYPFWSKYYIKYFIFKKLFIICIILI